MSECEIFVDVERVVFELWIARVWCGVWFAVVVCVGVWASVVCDATLGLDAA